MISARSTPSERASDRSSDPEQRPSLPRAVFPYVTVSAVVLASAGRLARAGFVGISDDDPARSLIAWEFARHPALDPTRSSWLPVHTYLVGAAMALTRELCTTSRLVSLSSALVCAWLAVALGRRLGAGPIAATVGATAAALFPWSAFCAWSPGVPELAGAAFLLAAVFSIAGGRGSPPGVSRAAWAGVALSLACGQRYEAWFASAGLCCYVGVAWRGSKRAGAALVAFASIVPLAWLCLNHLRAGDALDFLHRVETYRSAHETVPPLVVRLARFPTLYFADAGLLAAAALMGDRRRVAAPLVATAAILLGLALVDARGGGPTHHAARALLPCVWLTAPAASAALSAAWRRWRSPAQHASLAALAAAACVQVDVGAIRPPHDVEPGAVEAGRALRGRGACYAIETARLDFLWVEWASGAPERAQPDRPFGAPEVPGALATAAQRCGVVATGTDAAGAAMRTLGFRDEGRFGPWRILVASPP